MVRFLKYGIDFDEKLLNMFFVDNKTIDIQCLNDLEKHIIQYKNGDKILADIFIEKIGKHAKPEILEKALSLWGS